MTEIRWAILVVVILIMASTNFSDWHAGGDTVPPAEVWEVGSCYVLEYGRDRKYDFQCPDVVMGDDTTPRLIGVIPQ